jgi:hypothetical protein
MDEILDLSRRYRRIRKHKDIQMIVTNICASRGFDHYADLIAAQPEEFAAMLEEFESMIEQLPDIP